MKILGIDEAGRGSVIGPMVFGGVVLEKKDLRKLKEINVKDSKLLTAKQREELYPLIKKIAKDYVTLKVSAQEIDELRKRINLNKIEAEKIAQIIKTMGADEAYVDAPQVSTGKFKKILEELAKNHTKLIVENYADSKYRICGAASILAKVERDEEIQRLKEKTKFDLGVGYSHDERSREFVRRFMDHKKFSKYIRHSWVTVSDIREEKEQKNLGDFK